MSFALWLLKIILCVGNSHPFVGDCVGNYDGQLIIVC